MHLIITNRTMHIDMVFQPEIGKVMFVDVDFYEVFEHYYHSLYIQLNSFPYVLIALYKATYQMPGWQ